MTLNLAALAAAKHTQGEIASLLYHGCDRHRGEWIDCQVPICRTTQEEAAGFRALIRRAQLADELAAALTQLRSDYLGYGEEGPFTQRGQVDALLARYAAETSRD